MIFARDVERMTVFYQALFATEPSSQDSSPGFVVFDLGGTRFALHAIPPEFAEDIVIEEPPLARTDTPIKLIFTTADLDAACSRVFENGGLILPARGQRSRQALDPEGNVFAIESDP